MKNKTSKDHIVRILQNQIEDRKYEMKHNEAVAETAKSTINGVILLNKGLLEEINKLNNDIKFVEEQP